MNGKTAKLIRKYAIENEEVYSELKTDWNRTPRNKRFEKRKQMKSVATPLG